MSLPSLMAAVYGGMALTYAGYIFLIGLRFKKEFEEKRGKQEGVPALAKGDARTPSFEVQSIVGGIR